MDFKKAVLHPYFFLMFILLFLYKENIHQLEFTSILVPSAVLLFAIFAGFVVLNFVIKDKFKAGIATSLLTLFFFNYGRLLDARNGPPHIDAWIWKSAILLIILIIFTSTLRRFSSILDKKNHPKKSKKFFIFTIITCAIVAGVVFKERLLFYLSFFHPLKALYFITGHQILLLGSAGLFFVVLILWFKFWGHKEYSFINYYANFFSLILVAWVSIQIIFYFSSNQEPASRGEYFGNSFDQKLIRAEARQFPDVYYIILDGYAGQKTLLDDYDFDNSYFISELEHRRFYIAKESRSNYLVTFLSLTSSLNLEHITFLGENLGEKSKDRTVPYYLIDFSAVAKNFKSMGYKYVHLSSGWAATEDNPFADKVYDVFKLNEFEFVFLYSTPLRLLMPNERATTINYEFEKLQEIPSEDGLKFVFAHIEAPHPPYVFDKSGNIITNEMYDPSGEQWMDKEGYLQQLQYVNKKTIEVIDVILAHSEKRPIIIIQGDHGVDTALNWVDNPTKERLDERSYILNAYYLPNGGNDELYPSISPVNTFRVIFNYYFNQDYGLLDDTTYFSDYYKSPYNFTKVFENGMYVGPYPEKELVAEKPFSQKNWWAKNE